jgi:hypothetical protein
LGGFSGGILGILDVLLGVGRREEGLALVEVLNLASRVLCADEAAVKASNFVTLDKRSG